MKKLLDDARRKSEVVCTIPVGVRLFEVDLSSFVLSSALCRPSLAVCVFLQNVH
jgi:hypothetical protein